MGELLGLSGAIQRAGEAAGARVHDRRRRLMRRGIAVLAAAYLIMSVASAARTEPGAVHELQDERSAGDATVMVQSRSAFTQHVPGLTAEQL
jgi:hypothetical protein